MISAYIIISCDRHLIVNVFLRYAFCIFIILLMNHERIKCGQSSIFLFIVLYVLQGEILPNSISNFGIPYTLTE